MDVETVLKKHNVDYIPKGADFEVRCLNPDHEDRNPSMRIDQVQGTFHCFSCGYKGNIFHHFQEESSPLAMKREVFKRLVERKQAESVGLQFPSDAIFYTGDWRGISPKTYSHFKAFKSLQPEFNGRLVFPIYNSYDRIACFQGRHMGVETPKYKFWPRKVKVPLYPFFGTIQGSIILVEGIFDAINLYDKGLTNAVCSFGTDNVQKDKLLNLKMAGVEKIYIFFDGDDPGQAGAEKVKELCKTVEIPSQNICLTGTDPGELSLNKVTNLKDKLYD